MVQISTPKQVNIPEKIMKVEDMKIPLHILVHQNEHLQNAIDHFDLMQFFPNPIDIVAQIYLGMKKCEMFLTVNSIINKLTIPSKKSKDLASKEMSFDDFFPVYFSIVAVNPPPNSVQMKHFLDSIIGISIPVTFDYARLFFTSAVEYLEKYENNAPEEENIPLS
ncbi:hypothetical protein TRFO_37012 [Tritrichomonas foetus]|uniref:VPS9 domain-containing protein n=1 Tax=Tritrichomonas foetus TaxID=1144522 RepID=A0A1J4JC94_9EUKA|nr:hypothetical protein TRFO_37012 [Tritrichomonas foetus]|eukprot:OHS96760.1 hypothetical protein TRFO_37012 [Tritrichomonas foetus]